MLSSSIAHYKIAAKLGQGGMGEVYRATDTKLDREVAIKVLPQSVAQDKERLARFEREAKVLAQLNHPNIAGVYGLEQSGDTQALILELVEGEDLSARLKRGALPVDEALEVCRQIGNALAAAHAKGIIHRDLKPGNVKLTTDGKVKVLDFGLAKALSEYYDTSSISSLDDSPTITDAFTQPGTILGTAAYMSPEQARGKHVDKRTDIWAFGCVLYECLTGKKAFQGEDVTDTLARIIQGAPDWAKLPNDTSATIQLLARKCLAKDRKKRQQNIDDAIVDLEHAISDPSNSVMHLSGQVIADAKGPKDFFAFWMVSVALLSLTIGFFAAWIFKPQPPAPRHAPVTSADILLPHPYPITAWHYDNGFAISRLGDLVIYNLADQSGGIFRYDLTTGNDVKIIGAQGKDREGHAFLSPDGTRLGMIVNDDQLATIPVNGGTLKTIVTEDVTWRNFMGADWSEKDQIVFAQSNMPLRMVAAEGGTPIPVTELGTDSRHAFPQFLPDGRHVLFTVRPGFNTSDRSVSIHAEVLDLQTGGRQEIGVPESDFAMYVASGHLLYSLSHDVYAVPFDLDNMKVKGTGVKVLQRVDANNNRSLLDVSYTGTLVYLEAPEAKEISRTLVWVDKENQLIPFTQESGNWSSFSLSPDEKSVAIVQDSDIYLLTKHDDNFETFQPLVKDGYRNNSPVWAPDGKFIFFGSIREGKQHIYRIKPDFIDRPELLLEADRIAGPESATSNFLYISMGPEPSWDCARLSLTTPEPMLEFIPWLSDVNYTEAWLKVRLDGKYLTLLKMRKDERGTPLWVSSTERPSLTAISKSGRWPMWSKSGVGVYFLSDSSIYFVRLTYGEQIIRHEPEEFCTLPGGVRRFDISKDDSRALVLMNQRHLANDLTEVDSSPRPTHLKIKTNWFTELNRLVPIEEP